MSLQQDIRAPFFEQRRPLMHAVYKIGVYSLLPLMWISMTTGENRWELFGIGIGQFLYWVVIGLAWYIASLSRYQLFVTAMLFVAVAFRMLEFLGGGDLFYTVRVISLAIIFIVAGGVAYGRTPFLLRRQLTLFLALCLPIMLLQILGVSSLVMGWNTEYGHDVTMLAPDEVGTFKDIPLFPTLFVDADDLRYSIGQGRPAGLLYSNNVLSVFIAIAVALNILLAKTSRLKVSDLVITAAIVLAMSKMALFVAILLYAKFLMFGATARRLLALKLLVLLATGMAFYYFLFPGLFVANFSEAMMWTSILVRWLDIVHAVGFSDGALPFSPHLLITTVYKEEESYSTVALLLKSEIMIPALVVLLSMLALYFYRVRQMKTWPVVMYVGTFFVCALTQFAVPYAAAPSFQLILGFALFPLLKKLWQPGLPRAVRRTHPRVPPRPASSPAT